MEDPRDDEIVRLRAGLRRATQAAMAYAELSSKRIAELKRELAHRAETDAATIEALRNALAEARAANESSPSSASRERDERVRDERVRALERRLAEVELERDDAARSLAERVAADECTAAREEEEDEKEDARRALTARASEENPDDTERALESARRRCERAEKALDAFRLEGMALAAEAERASLPLQMLHYCARKTEAAGARANEDSLHLTISLVGHKNTTTAQELTVDRGGEETVTCVGQGRGICQMRAFNRIERMHQRVQFGDHRQNLRRARVGGRDGDLGVLGALHRRSNSRDNSRVRVSPS